MIFIYVNRNLIWPSSLFAKSVMKMAPRLQKTISSLSLAHSPIINSIKINCYKFHFPLFSLLSAASSSFIAEEKEGKPHLRQAKSVTIDESERRRENALFLVGFFFTLQGII